MKIVDLELIDLKLLEPKSHEDVRGKFVKVFNDDFFNQNGLNIQIAETYYSVSHHNVIRGMHFQTPPHDHVKMVYVSYGKILDVVLDIRKGSPTYNKYLSLELSGNNGYILVVPKGFAHGFKSLCDNTIVTYMQTSCYVPKNDIGIRYDSFGFDWECKNPKLSERDQNFPLLSDFDSPFIYRDDV